MWRRGLLLAVLLLSSSAVAQEAQPTHADPNPAVDVKPAAAASTDAVSGAKLDNAIKEAADSQQFLQPADHKVVSNEVKQAPPGTLANADGDISTTGVYFARFLRRITPQPTGECSSDINVFCADVKPGASQLADCLTQQLAEEQKEGYSGNKVSARCVKELDAFKIHRASNINKNVPLCTYCRVVVYSDTHCSTAKACKDDAEKFCKNTPASEPGAIITCLRYGSMH